MSVSVSVGVGVLISLTQRAAWLNESRRANLSARLQGLGQVRNFLQADAAGRRRGRAFVQERLPQLLPRAEALMRAAGTGEDFYLSKDREDFSAMHCHREQLGAFGMLAYGEFALVVEIIAFPDECMAAVKPLPDFGSNIEFLQRCFALSRPEPGKVPTCPGHWGRRA